MADSNLVRDVAGAEGCRLTAYRDTRGFWTIGYGHLLDQTIDWTGHEITLDTAKALLATDLDEREQQAQSLPEWAALDTPCRRNALVECVYNLGLTHWTQQFPRTRASLQAQAWTSASTNLLASPEWIAQVGQRRVSRLAKYFQDGTYPTTS